MLASLGQFAFGLPTLAYQDLRRSMDWKHVTAPRVGVRDASQFTGPGKDTVTLNGVLAPQLAGTLDSLDELRAMAARGDAYVLVDGAGHVYGAYLIESLDETQAYLQRDGVPRKITFSIVLRRVDERPAIAADEPSDADADESDPDTVQPQGRRA
ncbi:phage tail protein [Burkholderia sp. FERM BP-3421]|jgi:phage protein U|uniref:phage tail protein n=1 Tax=Burkholderia sp. FERM BP-3421 TaxID=1494466 RepID=UPI002362CDBA|nr:phage tail protein [Burkholderia sp. FERM BP-3421]WDD95920.1 phage tail protein [Burkholderia sp. FERM BP-3421]